MLTVFSKVLFQCSILHDYCSLHATSVHVYVHACIIMYAVVYTHIHVHVHCYEEYMFILKNSPAICFLVSDISPE